MLSAIISGAGNGSDILFLIGAVVAAVDAIYALVAMSDVRYALLPAALCIVSLGLLVL